MDKHETKDMAFLNQTSTFCPIRQKLRPRVVAEIPSHTREEFLVLRLLLDMTAMPVTNCASQDRSRFGIGYCLSAVSGACCREGLISDQVVARGRGTGKRADQGSTQGGRWTELELGCLTFAWLSDLIKLRAEPDRNRVSVCV